MGSPSPLADTLENTSTDFVWITFLRGEDAQLLLWQLVSWLTTQDRPPHEVRHTIEQWQRHARTIIGSQHWETPLDSELHVTLSEWLYKFWSRRQEARGLRLDDREQEA